MQPADFKEMCSFQEIFRGRDGTIVTWPSLSSAQLSIQFFQLLTDCYVDWVWGFVGHHTRTGNLKHHIANRVEAVFIFPLARLIFYSKIRYVYKIFLDRNKASRNLFFF